MRIKALKTFVSGRYDASRDEIIEVQDNIGQRLVNAGIAEALSASQTAEKPVAGKVTAKATKKASTAKSGAKTNQKK